MSRNYFRLGKLNGVASNSYQAIRRIEKASRSSELYCTLFHSCRIFRLKISTATLQLYLRISVTLIDYYNHLDSKSCYWISIYIVVTCIVPFTGNTQYYIFFITRFTLSVLDYCFE